jgi:hypothetical protein
VKNSGVVLRKAAIEEIEELLSLEEGPGVAMAARERKADVSARGSAGIWSWRRGMRRARNEGGGRGPREHALLLDVVIKVCVTYLGPVGQIIVLVLQQHADAQGLLEQAQLVENAHAVRPQCKAEPRALHYRVPPLEQDVVYPRACEGMGLAEASRPATNDE